VWGGRQGASPEMYPDYGDLHVGEMGDARTTSWRRSTRSTARPDAQIVSRTKQRIAADGSTTIPVR